MDIVEFIIAVPVELYKYICVVLGCTNALDNVETVVYETDPPNPANALTAVKGSPPTTALDISAVTG